MVSCWTGARRHCRTLLAAAAVAGVLAVSGCSAADPEPVPSPNEPTPAASSTSTSADEPTTDPQDVPSTGATPSRAPDPVAPKTPRAATRPGSSSSPSVSVRKTSADSATWTDGVRLRVDEVTSSTASGRGPGSLPGAPLSTFALTISNGSGQALDVSRVVLSAPYGSGTRRLAQQVYTDQAQDFSGTLAPKADGSATYVFAIPAALRSSAALVVDLDGRHALATLTGVAR